MVSRRFQTLTFIQMLPFTRMLRSNHSLKIAHWALLFCVVLSQISLSAPTVTLSRQHIAINESVELIVNLDKDEEIPKAFMDSLKQRFSVENLGRSSETSCVNFKCSSNYKTTLLLSPDSVGLWTIPALTISTGASKPLQIKVSEPNNDPDAGNLQNVFIELSLDKNQAYVDEQVLLTLKINSAIQLTNVQLSPIEVDNLSIKELNKTNYQRNLGGVPYTTYEITYALFGKSSGELSIPPVRASGLIPDGRSMGFGSFFNSGKRINIRSNALSLNVLPIPPNVQGDWLPAQSLVIKDEWLSDLSNAKVGESLTGEITVSALGLSSEQLPSLKIKASPDYKLYLEKPDLDNHQNENGIIGIRKEKFALVPNKAGTIEFPKIEVTWWDIATKSFKKASLSAKQITIKPNAEINQSDQNLITSGPLPTETKSPIQTPTGSEEVDASIFQPLFYASVCINLLLAGLSLLLFRRTKQYQAIEPTTKSKTNTIDWQADLSSACQAQDASQIKHALIQAVKACKKKGDIASLSDIQRLYPGKQAQNILQSIDKAAYENDSIVLDANKLSQIFCLSSADHKDKLNALYPTR